MQDSVVVLGARHSGKSTAGKLLAQLRQVRFHDASAEPWDAWDAAGFNNELCREISYREGVAARLRYMAPFHVLSLEKALRDHEGEVIEIGPHQVIHDDPKLNLRVHQLLSNCENVVLLQPSRDVGQSANILYQRGACERIDGIEFDEYFINHHSNFDLAKNIVYTKGKSPQETCADIARLLTPSSNVILIGPPNAGKSTIGRLLSERRHQTNVSLDAERFRYYREQGWNAAEQARIEAAEGFVGVYRYWKQFDLHAIKRILEDCPDCVIDFGAGHSVFEDDNQFAQAKALLAPYANVVLLLPSEDLDESVTILRERGGLIREGRSTEKYFLEKLAGNSLAKKIIYTSGQSPEDTARSILMSMRHPSKAMASAAR